MISPAKDIWYVVAGAPRMLPVATDFTTLSLGDIRAELGRAAAEADAAFGRLDHPRLNWRAEAAQWSVAQCLDHLLTANQLMGAAAERGLDRSAPRSLWQRLPGWPGMFGRMLIRSQAPTATRRFKADPSAQPKTSDIDASVVSRFAEQQRDGATRLADLDETVAAKAVMTSPFATFITYSVLDGWRLVVAHNWRHIEQARRVTAHPGFPR